MHSEESALRGGATVGIVPEGQVVTRIRASDCLLGRIRQGLHAGAAFQMHVEGGGTVWLDPGRERFFARIGNPHVFFAATQPRIEEGGTPPPEHGGWRPFEELLWDAAWVGSGGALLLDECQPFDVIELRHWPNFTRVLHGPHSMRIAALLSRAPITVSLAYRLLRVPADEMFRFYSAAATCGLVRVMNAADPPTAPAIADTPLRPLGFLSALIERIRRL